MYPKFLRITPLAFLALSALVVAGCDSNDPDDHEDENELITRVTLTLTAEGHPTATITATDPTGGTNFTFTPATLSLKQGITYTGTVRLFDDVNGEELTNEIREDGDHHQFFFTPSNTLAGRLTVTRLDNDQSGKPLGLQMRVVVSSGAAATGTLRIELLHYDRSADKVADSRAGGSTDMDITVPVAITQ